MTKFIIFFVERNFKQKRSMCREQPIINMVLLPIDQRYGKNDMIYIAKHIENLIG